MSTVRKVINTCFTTVISLSAALGLVAFSWGLSLIEMLKRGLLCLPNPVILIHALFNAANFNVANFIQQVENHDPNITLPIEVTPSFAGPGTCESEFVNSALKVTVPCLTVLAVATVAKIVSDCRQSDRGGYKTGPDMESLLQDADTEGSGRDYGRRGCC